jgi:hypothetical protein
MFRRILLLTLLLLAAGAFAQTPGGSMLPELVPAPAEVEAIELYAPTVLNAGWEIVVLTGDSADQYAAELLQEEIAHDLGWTLPIVSAKSRDNAIIIRDVFKDARDAPRPQTPFPNALAEQQGYRIWNAGDMFVSAPTTTGRFYGVQTLRQIIRSHGAVMPNAHIMDYPALEWRGLSDDISRGQISTIDDFRAIIRQLAFYKFNMYQPYIEDVFDFRSDPSISSERQGLTKSEMAMLAEEARRNHIELVPIFNSLGHQQRMLLLPHNRPLAELPAEKGLPWSFSPANPEAKVAVKRMIDEVAEATSGSRFFHIGGDEAWDIGSGASSDLVKEHGKGKIFGDYYSEMIDHLRTKHGREAMMYDDMLQEHEDARAAMDKDVVMIAWNYYPNKDFSRVEPLQAAGFKKILTSPGNWSWSNFYPNWGYGVSNMRNGVDDAHKYGLAGSVLSSWGDSGAENLRSNNWPSYAFFAAGTWEPAVPDDQELLRRFVIQNYGTDAPELANAIYRIGKVPDEIGQWFVATRRFHVPVVLRAREDAWVATHRDVREQMRQSMDTIDNLQGTVPYNHFQLLTLRHAADRYAWMAQREVTLDRIARMLGIRQSGELAPAQQAEIREELEALRNWMIQLTADFTRLWLETNKYPVIDENVARMMKQVEGLQKLIVEHKRGELRVHRENLSPFWTSEGDPTVSTEAGTRYFLRSVTTGDVSSATLTIWADDSAEVFINGESAGAVTINDEMKQLDVTALVKSGENLIAVQARNERGAAAVFLTLEINKGDSTREAITGDENWTWSKEPAEDWKTTAPASPAWRKVKVLGEGIIDPWHFVR